MSMNPREAIVYDDGRTKQAFKDSADINKILKKAQRAGGLAFVQKYDKQVYGEFENYDLLEAYGKINRAKEIFKDLPSEVRREFGNDAFRFVSFAGDPRNVDRLAQLIPKIAEPGAYFPNPANRGRGTGHSPTAPVGSSAAGSSAAPASASPGSEATPASSST